MNEGQYSLIPYYISYHNINKIGLTIITQCRYN